MAQSASTSSRTAGLDSRTGQHPVAAVVAAIVEAAGEGIENAAVAEGTADVAVEGTADFAVEGTASFDRAVAEAVSEEGIAVAVAG